MRDEQLQLNLDAFSTAMLFLGPYGGTTDELAAKCSQWCEHGLAGKEG